MNLFAGNLSLEMSQSDLEQAFGEFGEVQSVKIITDRESGRPRGFAFVEMSNDAEAQKAIQNLNGKEIMGRQMNVSEARPRSDRPRGNSRGDRRW